MKKIKRIALIGPESTGKTTLCAQLATHYDTKWVPEFAREYIAKLNRKYTIEDIEYCYKEQLKQEKELIKTANEFLFIDTELIVAKVWSEDVFQQMPAWIAENVNREKYDLYLLTDYDLPWQHDPVRENPNRREFFFNWYKRELEESHFAYAIIGGSGNDRLENSIKALESVTDDK